MMYWIYLLLNKITSFSLIKKKVVWSIAHLWSDGYSISFLLDVRGKAEVQNCRKKGSDDVENFKALLI